MFKRHSGIFNTHKAKDKEHFLDGFKFLFRMEKYLHTLLVKLQHNVIYTCWFQEVFMWFSVLSAPVSKETFVFLHCNYIDWHFSSTAPIKSVLSPADPETPWVSLRPSGTTAAVSFNYRFIHIWMWIIQWGRPSRAKQSQAEQLHSGPEEMISAHQESACLNPLEFVYISKPFCWCDVLCK